MKYRAVLILSGLIFLSSVKGQDVLTSHTKQAFAKFADSAITINGILSEWNFQDSIFFHDWHKRGDDDNSAYVKIRWDKRKLYLAYRVYDTKLNARHTENNREIFTDDCVELYISTNYRQAQEDKLTLHEHQFVVNINNALSTIRGKNNPEKGDTGKDFNWKTDVFAVVKTNGTINDNSDVDSGYVVEMAMNWTSIGYTPGANDTLLFDLCVEDRDRADTAIYYAFDISFLPQYFSQPKRWWKLILEEKAPSVSAAGSGKQTPQLKAEKNNLLVLFSAAAILALIALFYFIKTRRQKNKEAQLLPGESGKIFSSPYYEDVVKKVVVIIEEEYKSDLKTGKVADRLHISERHLQRILKENTGKRFRQYLNEERIKKSIELMNNDRLTLNEIAFEAGYQSYSHYIKIFKLYKGGMSPLNFREQNRHFELSKPT